MPSNDTVGVLHRLAHVLRFSYRGQVVSGTDAKGPWVGFECSTCGLITGKHHINVDRLIAAMQEVPRG